MVISSPKHKTPTRVYSPFTFVLSENVFCQGMVVLLNQEIIKVREWISHIGPLTKVIPLKLFLDIVPSSSADITGALRECFRGGYVYVSFHFVSKQTKTSNAVVSDTLTLIFWLQAKEFRLSVCFNTFRNFNRSLNRRRMSPAQTIGSLSNDDGNAKDDGWKKMDLNFTFKFRHCLDLFCKPSGLKPYLN